MYMPDNDARSVDHATSRLLAGVILGYAAGYLMFAVFGVYFFILKTALVPAFAIYALRSGAPASFARDWLPFLGVVVLFDAVRGGIYALVEAGVLPILARYPIDLERLLFGTGAVSVPVQAMFRADWLDGAMVLVHGAHFVFFLFFGVAVWHARRPSFWMYRRSMLVVMGCGALAYFVIPTAPPWLAAENGYLPTIARVGAEVYASHVPQLFAAYDTNPVAAMPSLHFAFPMACTLLTFKLFGWAWRGVMTLYTLTVGFSVVYLGDHYVVDLLAGAILAAAATALSAGRAPRPRLTLGGAVLVSAGLVAVTVAIAAVTLR